MFIFTETKTEADSAGEIQKNTSGAYNLSLSSKMYDKPIQKSCNIQTSARVNVGQIQIVFTVVHASCVQMHIKTGLMETHLMSPSNERLQGGTN